MQVAAFESEAGQIVVCKAPKAEESLLTTLPAVGALVGLGDVDAGVTAGDKHLRGNGKVGRVGSPWLCPYGPRTRTVQIGHLAPLDRARRRVGTRSVAHALRRDSLLREKRRARPWPGDKGESKRLHADYAGASAPNNEHVRARLSQRVHPAGSTRCEADTWFNQVRKWGGWGGWEGTHRLVIRATPPAEEIITLELVISISAALSVAAAVIARVVAVTMRCPRVDGLLFHSVIFLFVPVHAPRIPNVLFIVTSAPCHAELLPRPKNLDWSNDTQSSGQAVGAMHIAAGA